MVTRHPIKALVCSGGPSMTETAKRHEALAAEYPDLRIVVNGAINLFPDRWAHWYCAMDAHAYHPAFTIQRPSVGWCAAAAALIRIDGPLGWGPPLKSLLKANLTLLRDVNGPTWSVAIALALAEHLGATRIDLMGHDQAIGQPSQGGAQLYDERRLGRERQQMGEVVRLLLRRGVTVRRLGRDW